MTTTLGELRRRWDERRPGYASTVHDHRHPFTSVALRVDDIEDATQTLIMEFAPVRCVSFSVDQRGDRMTQHLPMESRVKQLHEHPALLTAASTK